MPTVSVLCLLLVALNIVTPMLNAARLHANAKPVIAPRWSVWHLLYVGEAVLLLLIVLTSLYFAGLNIVAKPLGISVQAISEAAAKSDLCTSQALLFYFFPVTLLQNVSFFGVPAAFIRFGYGIRLRQIGLPPLPPRRAVIAGLTLGLAFLAIAGSTSYGLEHLAKHYRHVPLVAEMLRVEQTNPVAQMATTLKKAGIVGMLFGILAVGIAAPFGEEMLFRGFALNVLAQRFGAWFGIVLSALLFAAPHTYSLIGQSVIFLMGIGLGYIYRNSGSLWTVIIIHAVNNTASIVFAYFN